MLFWIKKAPIELQPMLESGVVDFAGIDLSEVNPYVLTRSFKIGANFIGAIINGITLTRQPLYSEDKADRDVMVTEGGTIIGCRLFPVGFCASATDADLPNIDTNAPIYWPAHKDWILGLENEFFNSAE